MIYNLGRVVPLFKGDYDAATTYGFLDVVYYDNSSFVALDTTTGNLPTDTEHWLPVALKGTTQNPTPAQIQEIITAVETYMEQTDFVQDADYTHIDVIDNHTSTSTTNALAANQGKVLFDLIDDVNHEVDDLTNAFNDLDAVAIRGVSYNLFNKNASGFVSGFVNSAGGISSTSTDESITSPLIPIKANTVYAYQGINIPSTTGMYFRFVASDGTTGLNPLNPDNPSETFTFGNSLNKLLLSPSNAAYAQFTVKFTTNADNRNYLQLIETNELPTEYYPYDIQLKYEDLPQQLVSELENIDTELEAKAEYEPEAGKNLINPNDVQVDRYIGFSSDGLRDTAPYTNSGGACSGLIPVEAGKTYFLTRAIDDISAAFAFIKSDGYHTTTPLDPTTGEQLPLAQLKNKSRAYKAPSNAAYALICLAFSGWTDTATQIVGFQFEEGSVGTSYQPYQTRMVIPVEHLPFEFDNLVEEVETVQTEIDTMQEQIDDIAVVKDKVFNYNSLVDGTSFIETDFDSTYKLKNIFNVVRSVQQSGGQSECFNFSGIQKINKSTNVSSSIKSVIDDITPMNYGGYVGANHGFDKFYNCTVANHGKDYSDIGSVYSCNSKEYTIVDIVDNNTITICGNNTDTYPLFTLNTPTTGEYTYVSGGTHTGNFTVSAATMAQGKPVEKLDETFVYVDGKKITESGVYNFNDKVVISQNYRVANPASILSILQANSGTYTGHPKYMELTGVEYFIKFNVSYIFTDAAHCFTSQTLVFLQNSHFNYFGFIQAATTNRNTKMYIPKALPDTANNNIDYRLNANWNSTTITNDVIIDAAKFENENFPPDRFVMNDDNVAYSIGYLFDYGVGGNNRKDYLLTAFKSPSNTRKMYPYGVHKNKVGETQNAGNNYSAVCFRVYQPSSVLNSVSGEFLLNTFEYDNKFYIYADYNGVGTYYINIPEKYIGKTVEVFEKSNNVQLLTPISSNTLMVSVSTSNPMYGYLVAQIK